MRTAAPARTLTRLAVGYVIVSLANVGVIIALRHHSSLVNDTVWGRGLILAGTSLLLMWIAVVASRGHRGALLRLRIISAVLVVTVVVFIALPGVIPVWMKCEQAVCGALLVALFATASVARRPRATRSGNTA